jgi:hypothetical protein
VLLVKAPDGLSGLFRIARQNLNKAPAAPLGREFRGYRLRYTGPTTEVAAGDSEPDRLLPQSSDPLETVGAR